MISTLQDKFVTILGAQRSGIAAAKLLKKHGVAVFLSDFNKEAIPEQAAKELQAFNIDFETGNHSEKVFQADIAVISPGIPNSAPVIQELSKRGIEMLSEIEIASRFTDKPILAVTGSNGKTTTTTLIAEMLNTQWYSALLCGNIGRAFSDTVLEENKAGKPVIYVTEVSSFQLERIPEFRPDVALILNISPDHLDRYPNFEEYYTAKLNITKNQTHADELILNQDDPILKRVNSEAQIRYFSILPDFGGSPFHWNGEDILYHGNPFISYNECKLRGMHNLANILGALNSVVRFIPENQDQFLAHLQEVVRTFPGIEHRLEFVNTVQGVDYYNDSKATNVDSVRYAIESFNHPVFLILGGYDKNAQFTDLIPAIKEHARETIAIGKARNTIRQMLSPAVEVQLCEDLNEAVNYASKNAESGDVVLLSPACASFDQYNNYEERGNHFKQLVEQLDS